MNQKLVNVIVIMDNTDYQNQDECVKNDDPDALGDHE